MSASGESATRLCFVISPIGEDGSPERQAADDVLNYIIRPAVEACGFVAKRADDISEVGVITTQIIEHLIEDDLVVADLTGRNANVFYELAIRHAARKPFIHIIKTGERLPFDVAHIRTIKYGLDLGSADAAKKEIIAAIQSSFEDLYTDNPLFRALAIETLRAGGTSEQKLAADILTELSDFRRETRSAIDALPDTVDIHSMLESVASVREIDRLLSGFSVGLTKRFTRTIQDIYDGIGQEDAEHIKDELKVIKSQLDDILTRTDPTFSQPDEFSWGEFTAMADTIREANMLIDRLVSHIEECLSQG